MRKLKWIFRLIRIPNLLIILLSQVLLRYFIIGPLLKLQNVSYALNDLHFFLLVITTLLIAVAGYIINDYFDVDSDRVNKPEKIVIGDKIKFSTAKKLYYALNIAAGVIGAYLAWVVDFYQLALLFVLIMVMLRYYSARWQMTVFWGNLVVALLSGFTIYIVWLFEFFALREQASLFIDAIKAIPMINAFVWGYFAFAFLTTIIRELIKDMEDMKGDLKVGFRTLPAVKGLKFSKYLVQAYTLVTILMMAVSQYLLMKNGFESAFWYLLATTQVLLIYLLLKSFPAKEKSDFNYLSMVIKIIMVAGILSMQLVYLDIK